MQDQNDRIGRKVIWHLAKMPIVALVLLVLIASGPLPVLSGGIDCDCQYCEYVDWYDSLGGFERLWYNLKVIVQSFFS